MIDHEFSSSDHPMDKKTRKWHSILMIFNVLVCIAITLHLFNIPITHNVTAIIALILFIINLVVIFEFFQKYQYSLGLRIAMNGFFVYSTITFLFQFIMNFIGYTEVGPRPQLVGRIILLSFLGNFVYAAFLIISHGYWLNPRTQESIGRIFIQEKKDQNIKKGRKVWLIISISINAILLSFGVLIDYTYFFARLQGMFMMGVFAAMLSLLFGMIFLVKTFQIASRFQELLKNPKKKKIALLITFTIGLSISSVSFIPVMGVPYYIRSAEKEFDTAFTPVFWGDWEEYIPDIIERKFKKNHFDLLDYFVGPRYLECIQIQDVVYFNGSESAHPVDQSITLRFDAYLPPSGYSVQPGWNSTIIRIHGGGWVIGDKGTGNVGMMNRYLAHQGYCVFDIQYGLNNVSDLFSGIPLKPDDVMGNFTIDDMLRHIGNFTHYLEDHAVEYGANLDSVFVSGGSAGGQLTCATALSLASKNYTEFSDAYTIKGMIPFYPANNVSLDFALTSKPEWVDPVQMLNATSPACLIFQGKQDGLIVQSQIFQDAYHGFGRTDCAHIQFPFAGHANDIYYPGFYNQIFLYYMERFLYLYH